MTRRLEGEISNLLVRFPLVSNTKGKVTRGSPQILKSIKYRAIKQKLFSSSSFLLLHASIIFERDDDSKWEK